ncbi:MAG TPA: SDR family oxidoreductase [Pseudomonadales bacterium]|jgi:short-subunit dehydrogenase|nr:SDR family oxidoreductase [Pseudomonadales bacterium]
MARPRVLITGASSGIGAEFARRFAANGYDLILVARREALLNALRDELAALGANVLVIAKDLSLKTSAKSLYQDVKSCNLTVDVLVNNAGVAYGGAFTAMDTEAVQRMVLLNAATLATLTRLFVTDMVARGSGRILNISSLSAFQAVPSMTLYAATKAFVLSFTEGLAEELRGTGVTVTALCPGLTDTDMVHDIAGGGSMPEVPSFMISDVKTVVKEGYDACVNGEVVRVPGLANQISAMWSQTQPRWLVRTLGGMIGRQLLRP